MPKTEVIIFAEENGSSLLLKWLDQMPLREIDFAISHKKLFEADPLKYTYEG